MDQHLNARSFRMGDLKYGPYREDCVSGHRFLPNFQALMGCLDNIFRRYAVRHARALRARLDTEPTSLGDCDILQLLLDPVSEGRNTKPIAQALLGKFRTFGRVVKAPARELMAIRGIDEAGAAALKTVEVAAMQLLRHAASDKPILATSDSVRNYLTAQLQHERVEVFYVLFLDSARRLIECDELSRGTFNRTDVYPREVMRRCLELDATAIMMAHNHPAGSLKPSYDDITMTENVIHAASLFDITVIDSIIVGHGETFSMRGHDLF